MELTLHIIMHDHEMWSVGANRNSKTYPVQHHQMRGRCAPPPNSVLHGQKLSMYSFQLSVFPDLSFIIFNKALWEVTLIDHWTQLSLEGKNLYTLLSSTSTLEMKKPRPREMI